MPLEDVENDESAMEESVRVLASDQILNGDAPSLVRDALEDYKKIVHIDDRGLGSVTSSSGDAPALTSKHIDSAWIQEDRPLGVVVVQDVFQLELQPVEGKQVLNSFREL